MFKNIVIPVDLSDKNFSKAMLPVLFSAVAPYQAKLNLVYIIPNFATKMIENYLPKNWVKDQKIRYEKKLESIAQEYSSDEIKINCHVGRGAIYDEIIQYSTEINADLIALSAVRPQLKDYMLGSNASKIVRHSTISVIVIRD